MEQAGPAMMCERSITLTSCSGPVLLPLVNLSITKAFLGFAFLK
jgi:hypothetical protein